MTNETEKNITSDPTEKIIESHAENAAHVPKVHASSWGVIGFLFSGIALLTAILGGYFAYCYLKKSENKLAVVIAEVQEKQNAFKMLQQDINTTNESTKRIQENVEQLQQTVTTLNQEQKTDKNKWEIAQANYYVKLANAQLAYANNIPLAITLLKMADQIVHALSDSQFDNIRKTLASDVANLQSVPQVDITGIYMRLTALDNQIDKLSLPNQLKNEVETSASNVQKESGWRQGLQTTWQALQKIVVVRYNQHGILPLIPPDEQIYLYQNVHAVLAESIWALLHGQQTIYQTSLQRAVIWIKQYFSQDSSVAKAVINELNQLGQLNIHSEYPNVSASLQAFESYHQDNKTE